ncbi:MAG: hypothetical protein IAE97_00215 [Chthoniobacterales bacterium]|nr:hypothetical protein [Chthoniobacterales bacterium]
MNKQAVGTLVRGLLVALGGFLVGRGILTEHETNLLLQAAADIAPALLIIGPVLWDLIRRVREGRYKEALQEILGVLPDRNIGPKTVGAAEDLRIEVKRLSGTSGVSADPPST